MSRKSKTRPFRSGRAQHRASQAGTSAFAGVAAIAAIGIIFLVLFIFSNGGSKTGSKTPPPASPPPAAETPANQPAFIRIPEDYKVYTSKDFAFSFAYPGQWGDLTGSSTTGAAFVAYSTTFTNYALGSAVLNGQVTAFVYPKDQFKILTHDNGAQVTAVKLGDSYGWKVVQTGPADPKLQVGNDYTVKSATYQSNARIYDFSTSENGKVQGRWVFASGDNFVVVSLPVLSRANGTMPDGADLASYNAIGGNLAKTMRPTR